MNRDFDKWLKTFRKTNRTYKYWVDFDKVLVNANKLKVELNILNSLIGSDNIEQDFDKIIIEYPKCLQVIPLLLAIREKNNQVVQSDYQFDFKKENDYFGNKIKYLNFLRQTGLFDLIENRKIKNLYDYVIGVEVGLDTNARKNRGGKIMAEIIAGYFKSRDIEYQEEIYASDLEKRYGLDLSTITNNGQADKRFDFVVFKNNIVYGIEVNFYSSGGSKLNETARSYKEITLASEKIDNFKFVWITDGQGWNNAKRNLKETFDVLDDIYNLNDLENGKLKM